ncbi:MAG: Txe/YoeB family addiction module toxin [Spirochaetales bacterium]|nr:Txe/YoeB family addiction module toxin [Spirochaetales bacterium]
MIISFFDNSWEEYLYWQQNDRKMLKKLNELIKVIQRDPFHRPGKPEQLKHELQGCWSRRISKEHRIVYRVRDHSIEILSCRFHF